MSRGTLVVSANRQALEEKVDAGSKRLAEVFDKLANELGQYGFTGEAELTLKVTIGSEAYRVPDAVTVERKIRVKFCR